MSTDDKPEQFTMGMGMVSDVAKVIEEHGYTPFDGRELVELQQHLIHLLYGRARGDTHCTGGTR